MLENRDGLWTCVTCNYSSGAKIEKDRKRKVRDHVEKHIQGDNSCTACGKICRTLSAMRSHCRGKHNMQLLISYVWLGMNRRHGVINDDIIAFLYYIESQIGEIIRPGWSEPFPRLLPSERQQTDVRWSAASGKRRQQKLKWERHKSWEGVRSQTGGEQHQTSREVKETRESKVERQKRQQTIK